jgi:glycosyltransferase involved in cell wall biosynthesis
MEIVMADRKLLSIIIPTHNRQKYCRSAIDSILSFTETNFELVVHDTSDDDVLEKYVGEIDDSRLVYRKCADTLSMTENHNAAIRLSNGQYVCLIGDDDTVLHDLFHAAKWAHENNIEVISPEVVANYAWPDFKSKYFGDGHAGRLYIKKKYGEWSVRCSKKALKKLLKMGGQGTDNMPKLYHGLVKRSLLEAIATNGGEYFYGTAPDVSGSIGLALFSNSFIHLNYPLTLPGASGGSNTGRSAEKKHKGELADDPHTKRFKNLIWPIIIPQFVSVENVWAQSAYETLTCLKPGALEDYNYLRVYALNLIKHPEQRKNILLAYSSYLKKNNHSFVTSVKLIFCVFQEVFRLISTLGYRALTPTAAGNRNYIDNVPDIHSSQKAFEVYRVSFMPIKVDDLLSQIKCSDSPGIKQFD